MSDKKCCPVLVISFSCRIILFRRSKISLLMRNSINRSMVGKNYTLGCISSPLLHCPFKYMVPKTILVIYRFAQRVFWENISRKLLIRNFFENSSSNVYLHNDVMPNAEVIFKSALTPDEICQVCIHGSCLDTKGSNAPVN